MHASPSVDRAAASASAAFRILACAEIRREKVNLELVFPVQPSLHSLFHRIADAFTEYKRLPEAIEARGFAGDQAPFYIGQVAVLSKSKEAWVPLVTESQIEPNCQLYAFQPAGTLGVVDAIGAVPPPIPEPSHQLHSVLMLPVFSTAERPMAPRAVPKRKNAAAVPNMLFDLLDEDNDGVVTLFQLRDAMSSVGLDTSPESVGRSFSLGDRRLQREQFRGFYDEYPKLAAELHSKLLARKAPDRHGRSASPKKRWPSGSPTRRGYSSPISTPTVPLSSPPSLPPTAIMSPVVAANGSRSSVSVCREDEVGELRRREQALLVQLKAVQKRLAEISGLN